jgi:hypothetical protein
MLEPQNFSVYANNPTDITIDIDPNTIGLDSAVIMWCVYEQEFGQPVAGEEPVIEKEGPSTDGGILVTDADLKKITISLFPDDTVNLLRNYYHEATVDNVTVAFGIMTVIGTENREA